MNINCPFHGVIEVDPDWDEFYCPLCIEEQVQIEEDEEDNLLEEEDDEDPF